VAAAVRDTARAMSQENISRLRADLETFIDYFKGYGQREDALRDLGVSDDAVQPIDP